MLFRRIFSLGSLVFCLLFSLTMSGSAGFKPSVPGWLIGTWNNRYETKTNRLFELKFKKHSIEISQGLSGRWTELNRQKQGYRYIRQECSEGGYRIWLAKSSEDVILYQFMREEPALRNDRTTSMIMFRGRGKAEQYNKDSYLLLQKVPVP